MLSLEFVATCVTVDKLEILYYEFLLSFNQKSFLVSGEILETFWQVGIISRLLLEKAQ